MPRKKKKPARSTIIAGNWKMYKTIDEAKAFVETLAPLVKESQAQVYLAVPYTAIAPTVELIEFLKASLTIGAQNMNDVSEGAFTGEIAGRMLVDAGAKFVILGHSERRHLFNEDDAFINKKVKRALKCELQPILCVGETLEQREAEQTEQIIEEQILNSLKSIKKEDVARCILAYEPVWAIGTGKVSHPDDAEHVHAFIREVIAKNWDQKLADELVIQYGGSVKADNAGALLAKPNIDGLLVGGASLSADSFSQIINGLTT